jgi:hypothetical protein
MGNDPERRYEGLAWPNVLQVALDWVTHVSGQNVWTGNEQAKDAFTAAQDEEAENAHFTQDEQRQIAVQLQDIKRYLEEQLDLPGEQIARVEEKLNEATEASMRMGRKTGLSISSEQSLP